MIRDLGLELQIVFNKGAVMVLPAGINKASGLSAALSRLRLSPLNVVGIGGAENDHAFLRNCGCAVAVANALPMVKENADLVTSGPRGAGVAETIGLMLDADLAGIASCIERQTVHFARDSAGEAVRLHPQSGGMLTAGTVRDVHPEQVDDDALLGVGQQLDNLVDTHWRFRVAQYDGACQIGVIALRVDEAELKAAFPDLLDNSSCRGRCAAAGRPNSQHSAALRMQPYRFPG